MMITVIQGLDGLKELLSKLTYVELLEFADAVYVKSSPIYTHRDIADAIAEYAKERPE